MAVLNHLETKKRPQPLQPGDYDHEIFLVDQAARASSPESESRSRSRNSADPLTIAPVTSEASTSGAQERRQTAENLRRKRTLQKEIAKRRYAKYQDRHDDSALASKVSTVLPPDTTEAQDDEQEEAAQDESRGRAARGEADRSRRKQPLSESAIDILYENQRGGFLCGLALFSSAALGASDAPPWTNSSFKPSATNIHNAQPPDPSWEWAWAEWKINHDEQVKMDEDGWEYSFMFSKKFSWHGPRWYNSYVRRRAWIRKRERQHSGYKTMEGHMLNSDYFTIHPNHERERSISPDQRGSSIDARYSLAALAKKEAEEAMNFEDIRSIGDLMKSLKFCRIDREKTEAVESFVKNGDDELYYLKERMAEIMSRFIFQSSRKHLLAHLSQKFEEATDVGEAKGDGKSNPDEDSGTKRLKYLEAAIAAADEQVKRLEFWSDIKRMAEDGDTQGALDESQGWTQDWQGLDNSGPKDVISERRLPGFEDENEDKVFGDQPEHNHAVTNGSVDKGKEKE